MKKFSISILATTLLAGALFANDTHMGDHMHNGVMTNHSNPNGMTNAQMEEMIKSCKNIHAKYENHKDSKQVQNKSLLEIKKLKEAFSAGDSAA